MRRAYRHASTASLLTAHRDIDVSAQPRPSVHRARRASDRLQADPPSPHSPARYVNSNHSATSTFRRQRCGGAMRKHAYLDSVDTATDCNSRPTRPTDASGLPNRLMTAFEVAEFIGCHEETVRRAYLRGLLDVATLRRQRKEVSSRRRPRLDSSRSTNESLVTERRTRMAVRKICKQKGCRASPRCEHPWWFDVMHKGKRWRMPVDDFASRAARRSRSRRNRRRRSVWEPKFLAEIVAGRDPRVPPNVAEAGGRRDGRRLPRPVLHELRRGGGPARSGDDQGPAQGDQGSARRSAGRRAGKAG